MLYSYMAWSDESRRKALESKRLSGRMNAFCNPDYKISDETKQKMGASFRGKHHSEKTKAQMSKSARASTHRRLKRGIVNYICVDGSEVKMDSSWEVLMAKRLDSLNITWCRPLPIKWIDLDGLDHNYFPDFYLPDYDIYLDPKNPYAVIVQQEKIVQITKQIPNLYILSSVDEIQNWSLGV